MSDIIIIIIFFPVDLITSQIFIFSHKQSTIPVEAKKEMKKNLSNFQVFWKFCKTGNAGGNVHNVIFLEVLNMRFCFFKNWKSLKIDKATQCIRFTYINSLHFFIFLSIFELTSPMFNLSVNTTKCCRAKMSLKISLRCLYFRCLSYRVIVPLIQKSVYIIYWTNGIFSNNHWKKSKITVYKRSNDQ